MKQKIIGVLSIIFLLFPQTSFVLAQTLDPLTTDNTVAEPVPITETVPVEETVTPPADTTGPAFISIAAVSAQETEATIVWTTDEMAYGYIQYGETTDYKLATPKSTSTNIENTVSITSLTPGTTYHYRIVAEDENGNISYSQDRTLETAVEVVAIDNVPPEITSVSVDNITTSEATISWATNEIAQGKIEYGKTAEYGLSSPLAPDYTTEQSAPLSNLDPNTEYHYRVIVQDESGNETVSPDEIFITDIVPAEKPIITEPTTTTTETNTSTSTTTDTKITSPSTTTENTNSTSSSQTTIPFVISNVETTLIGTSTAKITWETNQPATSQVYYDTSESYTSSSATHTTNFTSHEVKLTNLKSGTNYFYKVISKNISGQTVEKGSFEFNTLYKQKIITTPPIISNISVISIGTSSATITFNTDIPAGGKINYGTNTGYEETDGGHNIFLLNHSHPLSDLQPNTTYNFETVVWDSAGNQTIYENIIFTTLPKIAPLESKPIAFVPTPTLNKSSSGSGSVYRPQTVIGKPVITKIDPLDKEVLFIWQKTKPENKLKTVIIRNENRYTSSPIQGTEVYRGNSGRFADINLDNDQKYYYSLFRVNEIGTYSAPLHITVIPKQNKTQTNIIATPPVIQKIPIYTFSKILSRGEQNKQVEHLQVLLASEPSIYQKGLITGYFGTLTENAVKKFQKKYKLPVTGVANIATLKNLEKLSSIKITKDKAQKYDEALARDLTIGRTGEDVSILQQLLIDTGAYPQALVTGYFGLLTKVAVQRFQKEQNIIPASGYFGSITKKRILNLIRLRDISF